MASPSDPLTADDLNSTRDLGSHSPGSPSDQSGIFQARGSAPLPAAPWDVSQGKVLGDYSLIRCIGRGGMGEVWEAEQISWRQRVAIKLLLPDRVDTRGLEFFSRGAGLEGAVNLIMRGGAFNTTAAFARSAFRFFGARDYKGFSVGLRPARNITH